MEKRKTKFAIIFSVVLVLLLIVSIVVLNIKQDELKDINDKNKQIEELLPKDDETQKEENILIYC